MQEEWKPVPGFESLYEVSALGNVRSLDRFVRSRWGTPKRVEGTQKSFSSTKFGYLSVHLYSGGRCTKWFVHRLVATVFLSNEQKLPQVNHLDGDKSNNAASNLQWCSGSENCMHAIREELYAQAKGERCSTAKITEDDVRDIRLKVAQGFMHKELADIYGIGRKAITKIVNHQRWKHVT